MIELARDLGKRVVEGERLWLFLDYDGTLAEFAPTQIRFFQMRN